MERKKIVINIAIIGLFFILFVVWEQNFIHRALPTSTTPSLKNNKFYLITTDNQDEFWKYINEGASDMASLTGVKYFWKYPDERNPQKQIEVINEAIKQGASALLISADDTRKLSGVVEDAKAKGIEVIYVDAPATEEAVTTLSTNNYEAGIAAGEKMISYLKKKKIESGSIGIITFKDKVTESEREKGFRDALAKEPQYQIVPTIYSGTSPESAEVKAEQLMSTRDDLVGLFATNEPTSEGVGKANSDVKNKYTVVGFDKSEKTKELLDGGSIDVIIEQNPYTMGYVGMAEAIAAVLGKKTGPNFFNTGFNILEK